MTKRTTLLCLVAMLSSGLGATQQPPDAKHDPTPRRFGAEARPPQSPQGPPGPQGWSRQHQSKVECTDHSQRLADLPPAGDVCEKREYAKRGKPVFFEPQGIYVYGVSSSPEKPNEISIWLDNQTDQAQDYYMCCRASFLLRIDLYDSSGRLVPGGMDFLFGCGCSGWVRVKPHTIKFVDGGDLKDSYTLKPGSYTISQKPLSVQKAAEEQLPGGSLQSANTNKPTRTSVGPVLALSIP